MFWSRALFVTSKLPYPHFYPIPIRYGSMRGTIEIIVDSKFFQMTLKLYADSG